MSRKIKMQLKRNQDSPYYDWEYVNGNRPRQVVLTGSGFGANGPDVVLFDRFNGAHGEVIPSTRTADRGQWGGYGYITNSAVPTFYSANGRTWMAARGVTDLSSSSVNACGMFFSVASYFTQFRYSKRALIPDGYNFPGASSPGTFPAAISTWKMSWFADIDGSGNFTGEADLDQSIHDLCIPTHSGSGSIIIDGNTTKPRYYDLNPTNGNQEAMAFSLSTENLFCRYQSGDESAPGARDARVEAIYVQGGSLSQYARSQCDTFRTESGTQSNVGFRSFRTSGWMGNGSWSNVLPLLADEYLAIGQYSRAAIFVSDNPVFASSTKVYLLPPDKDVSNDILWSDSEVRCTPVDYEQLGYYHVLPAVGAMIQNVSWEYA